MKILRSLLSVCLSCTLCIPLILSGCEGRPPVEITSLALKEARKYANRFRGGTIPKHTRAFRFDFAQKLELSRADRANGITEDWHAYVRYQQTDIKGNWVEEQVQVKIQRIDGTLSAIGAFPMGLIKYKSWYK